MFCQIADTFTISLFLQIVDLMINSIEKRYDAENRSILCEFGYVHPKRITTPDSFKLVKVADNKFKDALTLKCS